MFSSLTSVFVMNFVDPPFAYAVWTMPRFKLRLEEANNSLKYPATEESDNFFQHYYGSELITIKLVSLSVAILSPSSMLNPPCLSL